MHVTNQHRRFIQKRAQYGQIGSDGTKAGYKFVKDGATRILPAESEPNAIRRFKVTIGPKENGPRDYGMPSDQIVRVGIKPMVDLDEIRDLGKAIDAQKRATAEKLRLLPLSNRVKDKMAAESELLLRRSIVATVPNPYYKKAAKLFIDGYLLHPDHAAVKPDIESIQDRNERCKKTAQLDDICRRIEKTIESTDMPNDRRIDHLHQLQNARVELAKVIVRMNSANPTIETSTTYIDL